MANALKAGDKTVRPNSRYREEALLFKRLFNVGEPMGILEESKFNRTPS